MRTVGVIAEYDPFHSGHAWQLAELRRLGYDNIVVVLSDAVTQRGSLATLPTAVRTAAALACGASLVVALPAPYACATAEQFAAAGVALQTALPCVETLAFGAEEADSARLMETARMLESAAFAPALRTQLAAGLPFAAARAAAAEQLLPSAGTLLQSPNNILGVEYCKAILRQGSRLQPLALPRRGAAHGGLPAGGFASASHLRGQLAQSGVDGWQLWVPEAALALYRQADAAGQLLNPQAVEVAMLSRLRALSREQLAATRGVREGLENRLADAVCRSGSLPELYETMQTKRYPRARLRRLVLDAALGYTGALPALPPYLHLLGAAGQGMRLAQGAALPCGAGLAQLEKAASGVAKAQAAATDLAALCRRRPAPMGLAYTQKPILLPE